MKTLIEEYGKYAIYFLIASILLPLIFIATRSDKEYIQDEQKSNLATNKVVSQMAKPVLTVKSTTIVKGSTFNPLQYVQAKDSQGKNITNQVEVFGNVDTTHKGMYDIKYVVRDSYGLFTKKVVTFVVD